MRSNPGPRQRAARLDRSAIKFAGTYSAASFAASADAHAGTQLAFVPGH